MIEGGSAVQSLQRNGKRAALAQKQSLLLGSKWAGDSGVFPPRGRR